MNWMLIVVLAVLAIATFCGYKKGLIRVVYSIVIGFVLLFLLGTITPKLAEGIKSATKLDENLTEAYETRIRDRVEQKREESGNKNEEYNSLEELGIHIPEFVLDKLESAREDASNKVGDAIDQSGVYTKLAEILSDYTVLGITMLVLIIVLIIVYFVVERLLDIISKLPIIKQANGAAGAAVGLLYGLFFVWIAFGVITLFSGTPAGVVCNEQIQASKILVWLFDHNPILRLVLMFL